MSFLWPTLEVRSNISTCDNAIEAVTEDDVRYVIYSTAFINTINSYKMSLRIYKIYNLQGGKEMNRFFIIYCILVNLCYA